VSELKEMLAFYAKQRARSSLPYTRAAPVITQRQPGQKRGAMKPSTLVSPCLAKTPLIAIKGLTLAT